MTLHELVEAGDLARVREAVNAGADVNGLFPESDECPLSVAAATGRSEMVQLLLELGAGPNIRKTVTPPLTAAVHSGSLEYVQALLEEGAEIDVKDEDGATPLMAAAAGGQLAIVQELLGRGANPKIKDRYKNTALSVAAEKNHPEICEVLMPLATQKEREKVRIQLEIHEQGGVDDRVNDLIMAATRGD